MKITKGQLKRIIAEEHKLVYGKPTKTRKRKPTGRRKTKKQYMNEAKRQVIIEIQSKAIANQVLEEGLWDMIKGAASTVKDLAGDAGAAAQQKITKGYEAVKGAGEGAWDAAGDYVEGLKTAGNEKLADVSKNFLENTKKSIEEKIKAVSGDLAKQIKKIDDGMSDDEIKTTIANLVGPAVMAALQESIQGKKRTRLIENRKRRAQRAKRTRR